MNCTICKKVSENHNDYGLCVSCTDAVINEIDQREVVRAIKVVRSNTCVQSGKGKLPHLGNPCVFCGISQNRIGAVLGVCPCR